MPNDLHPRELRALGAAVRELRGELNVTFRMLLKVTRRLDVRLSELIEMYERNRAAR